MNREVLGTTLLRERVECLLLSPVMPGSILPSGLEEALCFFLYGKLVNNSIYEAIAGDLLTQAIDNINNLTPALDGLCGLGFVIDLMSRSGIIEIDSLTLTAIDRNIMMYDPYRIPDISFAHGLRGIVNYVHYRISVTHGHTGYDSSYIANLNSAAEMLGIEIPYETSFDILWKNLITAYRDVDIKTSRVKLLLNICKLLGSSWIA